MLEFAWPHALLLALPVAALLARFRAKRRLLLAFQIAIAALALLALAQPRLRLRDQGSDVVLAIDRSLSMPADAQARVAELAGLVAKARRAGDCLSVVTFGEGVQVQMLRSPDGVYDSDPHPTNPHASDLKQAIETALALVPTSRAGRLLVLSDGEHTGPSPIATAREAAARGIPIDHRLFGRAEEKDLAIERLVLPHKVSSGEPFQFSAVVVADQPTTAEVVLLRGDTVLSRDRRSFAPGANRLVFRDAVAGRGACNYHLKVVAPGDPRPENNISRSVVEVVAPPALMLVNATGQDDSLTLALKKAGLPVRVFAEDTAPRGLDAIQGYRGVILENVLAGKLGRGGMLSLARFVEQLGGGLLVTGGPRSFANGGYFRSPLDPVLPVSMEIRQEHRKVGIALAVALDRSGSMAVPVAGGVRKMDLANLGTVAALEVLGPTDSAAVIAVDSIAHIIQPLTPCDELGSVTARVKRIESMGGGIFVYEALLTAGKQLEFANQATRHILLFADAADSEEPGKYKDLLDQFQKMNVTVSVIGLGTEKDCDAGLLKDIAARGKGQVFFTSDAKDLPRLFAQDTLTVTRSAFIEAPTPLKPLPGLLALSGASYAAVPPAGGYNLTYLRPRATSAIDTVDEYAAPALAFWQQGLGRAAALTVEVDGKCTGDLRKWKSYGDFLVTLGRYVLGEGEPEAVQATLGIEGGEGVLAVEIDPEKPPAEMSNPMAVVVPPSADDGAPPLEVPLEWVGPARLEARFPVKEVGNYRAAVRLAKGAVVRTNPATLPYSPEFAPRRGQMRGKETLGLVSKISGGRERLSTEGIYGEAGMALHAAPRDVTLPVLVTLLVLVVLEIAERRLGVLTAGARLAAGGLATARAATAKLRTKKPKAKPEAVKVRVKVEEEEPKPAEKPPAPAETPDEMESVLRRVKRRHRA